MYSPGTFNCTAKAGSPFCTASNTPGVVRVIVNTSFFAFDNHLLRFKAFSLTAKTNVNINP